MIKFAKVKTTAVIPSKREGDAGYDVYPCFEDEYIVIKPHETVIIPCGIASAFDKNYVALLQERGSTGTRGMAKRAGVIDSNYRGEWLFPITNTTEKLLYISKVDEPEYVVCEYDNRLAYNYEKIIYPYTKAIGQVIIIPIAEDEAEEVSYNELLSIKSNRGQGKLGSTGK